MLGIYRVLITFIKGLDRRFKLMVAAMGVHQLSLNLPANYSQLYVVGLGANPVELGFLSSLGGLVSSIIIENMGIIEGLKTMYLIAAFARFLMALIVFKVKEFIL